MLSHFLIGVPGAGKSTFAQQLAQLGDYQIISTDTIRQQLYGEEIRQGNWLEIEAEVINQIRQAISSNTPIIYDATNAKRAWRMDLLGKIRQQTTKEIQWLAWYLHTSLDTCKQWNQNRQRQVPEGVIESMAKSLKNFPPLVAEGFIDVKTIKDGQYDTKFIHKHIKSLPRTLINRNNRTKNESMRFHAYSRLLDFDRLMHLISLLIHYPGLGNLHQNEPSVLEDILGEVPEFNDSLAEITAVMAKRKGKIYADREKIQDDLTWLNSHGLVHRDTADFQQINQQQSIELETVNYADLVTHAYSEIEPFQRLLNTINLISYHPFLPKVEQGYLNTLTAALAEREDINDQRYLKSRKDLVRKDIEIILKPYGILSEFTMRNGYFLGTGILSARELKQTFDLLQAQAKSIDDPLALAMYQTFKERMKFSKLATESVYPVRAIANRSIIDTSLLHPTSLSHKIELIEQIIEQGKLVQLNKFVHRGKFAEEETGAFDAWLLQITFYNFAWYLGFEHHQGKQAGLLRFERLDRLFLTQEYETIRSQKLQEKSLERLHKLLDASPSIFLGYNAREQRNFLSTDTREKKKVMVTIELWFSKSLFNFIAEGTKRFPKKQMKMSSPPQGSLYSASNNSLFSLGKSKDKLRPYRFQVSLPKWSLQDFELIRWILGFGRQVYVEKPLELRNKIIEIVQDTINSYVDG